MTASELPAKWGADSRDDGVVCRVEEGRAAAAHPKPKTLNPKTHSNKFVK